MRITFVNRYFYPDISATSQLLTELAEDLDARGETVRVITGNRSYLGGEERLPSRDMHHGIRIVRVGFTHFGRAHTLGRLADYLSFYLCAFWATVRLKDQECLIMLSDPPLLSILAATVRIFKPIKTVCWLQDVFPDIAVRAGLLREGIVTRVLRRIALWSLRQMDEVVVIGRCMERRLLALGFAPPRLSTIPNWADGSHIQPRPRHENSFANQHGLQDRFVVMYSGNHGVVHEFESLVALIRKTHSVPRICFCFVGEGTWKHKLMETARVEAWPHILFLPYQPKTALQASLSAAAIHLVSLRTEMEGLSIPSKIYGVLAAGRPVIFIGPPGSETTAIIREAECGYCVEPGDTHGALQALLAGYHDPALLEKQGAAARRYFDRHCDRSMATERFREVLHCVCEQPVPGRGQAHRPLMTDHRLPSTDAEPLT